MKTESLAGSFYDIKQGLKNNDKKRKLKPPPKIKMKSFDDFNKKDK